MAQLSIHKCSFCDLEKGAFYCYDCELFLCQTCKPFHNRFPANKEHTVIDAKKEGHRVFKPKPVCEDHKKGYSYYCKECDCLICSDCTITAHSGHPCCDSMKVFDQRKQHVIEIIETIKLKVHILEDSLNTINTDKLPKINFAADDYAKQVNAVANEIGSVIDHARHIHTTTASDFQSNQTEKITKVRENLERAQKNYKVLLMKFEHVLLEQHGVTFLFEQKALQIELDNFDQIPEIPTADLIPNFNPDDFGDHIIDELQKKFNIRDRHLKKWNQEIDEKKKLEQELLQTKDSLQKMKTDFEREMQYKIDLQDKFKLAQSKIKQQIEKCKQANDEKKNVEQELLQTTESLQKLKTEFESYVAPCYEQPDAGFRQMTDTEPLLKRPNTELSKDAVAMGATEGVQRSYGSDFGLEIASCQEDNPDDFSSSYQTDKVLVAAIYFGMTCSGYAFSFKSWFETDPYKIVANTAWVGKQTMISPHTLTCVLLKPDKTFHSFGYEAEAKYAELALDEKHDDWYFFKRFTMSVYNNTTLSCSTEISDITGKTLPAKTVFSHCIRFLKEHLCLELSHTGINESDIHWVLTVPAIWNNTAKQFMKEAAFQAGIKENHLMIASEAEAAAIYCRLLPVEKFVFGSKLDAFQRCSKCMIADLGDETVDITVLEVLYKNNFRELHKASGGAWGGTKVNENFMQLIATVVGDPVIKRFKEESKSDYINLSREFEIKTRRIRPDSTGKILFRIPILLVDLIEEDHQEDLETRIKQTNFSKAIKSAGDHLRIEADLIKQLFTDVTESVVQHLKDLFKNPLCCDVDTILMVGAFSECHMVQEAIKSNFKDKNIIIPEKPEWAVFAGAVLFGHLSK